eukprot:467236-Pyramimonas_sp.AAC.1
MAMGNVRSTPSMPISSSSGESRSTSSPIRPALSVAAPPLLAAAGLASRLRRLCRGCACELSSSGQW